MTETRKKSFLQITNDSCVVNSWILYKESARKDVKLLQFVIALAETFAMSNNYVVFGERKMRGRPSPSKMRNFC